MAVRSDNRRSGWGVPGGASAGKAAGLILTAVLFLCLLRAAPAEGFHVEQALEGELTPGSTLVWTMMPRGGTGPCRVLAGVTMIYENGSAEVLDTLSLMTDGSGGVSIRVVPPHGGTLCLEAEWTDEAGLTAMAEGEYAVSGVPGEEWPGIAVTGPSEIMAGEETVFSLVPSSGTPPYAIRWDAFLTDGEGNAHSAASGGIETPGGEVLFPVSCPRAGSLEIEARVTDALGLKAYAVLRCDVKEPVLRLTAAKTELEEGESVRLIVTESGRIRRFSSGDEGVIRVDGEGNATAVGSGSAVVTVSDGTEQSSLRMTVRPAAESLSAAGLTLSPGGMGRIRTQLLPEGAAGTLMYFSSDESVAAVDADGTVRAVSPGSAQVAVVLSNAPQLTAFASVTVLEETDEHVRAYIYGMEYGDGTLSALYGAVGRGCVYTLELQRDGRTLSVKTREEAGVIRFYLADPDDGAYTVTVTAEDENGVISSASASGLLDREVMTASGETRMPLLASQVCLSGPATVYVGDRTALEAQVLPAGAEGALRWESTDPGVARVDENGVLTALSPGWTTVRVLAADGSGAGASLDVECVDDSLTLGMDEIRIPVGESLSLAASGRQKRAYTFIYTSSDGEVLSVLGGTAVGLREGTCVLTVTAEGTPLALSVPVTVLPCRHLTGEWHVTREPGCETAGERVLICSVCGQRAATETIPAAGHDRGRWETLVPAAPRCPGERVRRCTVCGGILERDGIRPITETTLNRNTACTEGITFRSMFPVKEWYMFTPVDLTVPGVQTLRLIAGNMYQIGTVYLTVTDDHVTVDYDFVDSSLEFTDEFITFLPSLDAFRGTEDLSVYRNYAFGVPFAVDGLADGEGKTLLFMCCRLNYSRNVPGLVVFSEYQASHLEKLAELRRILGSAEFR